MPSTINADNGVSSGSAGLKSTADSSGVLSLQTNGTTALSISTGQVVTLTNALPAGSGGTGLTSFTANGVVYASSTSALATGSALTFDGNALTLGGSAPFLKSNMTGSQSTRFGIQNSTTNGNSRFYVYPNGTGTISAINMWNNSDPTAANYNAFDVGIIGSTDCRFSSQAVGSATYIPFTWYFASEVMRLDTSGNLGIGLTPVANNGILQLNSYGSVQALMEKATISATAATGTVNYDAATQAVLYYTTNASANWTLNIRGSSGLTLNNMMQTGQSLTVAFLVTQGATAYYASALTVDGASVTPKYQGGSAWTSGNASSIDAYVYTVVKTGSAAFTVFASQTQFK